MTVADYLTSRGWSASAAPTFGRDEDGEEIWTYPRGVGFNKGFGEMSATRALEIERMNKWLVYDIEIIKAIDTGGFREKGIEYVDGWANAHKAGIAVLVAYPNWIGYPLVFGDENLKQFGELVAETQVITGHNIISFDNKLCAEAGIIIPKEKCYDTLAEIKNVIGQRTKLDQVCMANFGLGKTDDGALAPFLWQKGWKLRVMNYCMGDVMRLSKPLFELILRDGAIKHPYTPSQQIRLRHPFEKDIIAENEAFDAAMEEVMPLG